MVSRRQPMRRILPSSGNVVAAKGIGPARYDEPRSVRSTTISFCALDMPEDVRLALAEAFWIHFGVRSEGSIHLHWFNIKTFDRFAQETGAMDGLTDVHTELLIRYVEWLNAQRNANGEPWSKSSRGSAYTTLRKLLQWLQRCRPDVLSDIEYPFNPFPWRNRDTPPKSRIPAQELRSILRACEIDITRIRAERESAVAQCDTDSGTPGTLGWLLHYIDQHCGGIVPSASELSKKGWHPVQRTLQRHGGLKQVEPCLYPRTESLLPYYVAILIHTAGNPDPIAELDRDCLQSLPLLDNREALVWFKARANATQRRTFSNTDPFEPPTLVKDILDWNARLQALAPAALRNRLFLFKGKRKINVLLSSTIKHGLPAFCERHGIPRFSLASIRPSVLTSFYRASGDLRQVSTVANHANLSTTVRYVQAPEVEEQNRVRIADLQTAFIGHVDRTRAVDSTALCVSADHDMVVPAGEVVSMFGFDCKDPFAGTAPGTHRGSLCTSFMGCFNCPNAIITSDPPTLARLLQARDHLRFAASRLHPARWKAVYAPQLHILEEDILPRFTSHELAAALPLVPQLPPLPDLR